MTSYKGNKSLPPALVLDLSATGVAVARMLASHGVDVYGAEARVDSIGNSMLQEVVPGNEEEKRDWKIII